MNNVILKISPLGFPWETKDPFIFCAYHRDLYPKGNELMGPNVSISDRNIGQDFEMKNGWRMYHGESIPGFPYHPHRGFETITINKEGIVDHSDSLGAAGRFGTGDVQWMTAGKGVQHSEMFPLVHQDKENPLEIFQIWLNLPKKNKFTDPHFKMLWREDIPEWVEKNENGQSVMVNVIAGDLNNIKAPTTTPESWAANPDNDVAIWTIKLESGMEWVLPKSTSLVNRALYFYKGNTMHINERTITSNNSIQLISNQDCILKSGEKDCYLLMLQGKPINEPVVQYGPFVMNSEKEIQQAFEEYKKTQFGGWPWPKREQIHDRDKGRFALHADGTREIK